MERDREAGSFVPLAIDAAARVLGRFGLVEVAVRPRSATPCRCTTRYREDSPIPKRSRMSDVGMLVSAYSRAMSRFSSGLNLRRREPTGCAPLACVSVALSAEVT